MKSYIVYIIVIYWCYFWVDNLILCRKKENIQLKRYFIYGCLFGTARKFPEYRGFSKIAPCKFTRKNIYKLWSLVDSLLLYKENEEICSKEICLKTEIGVWGRVCFLLKSYYKQSPLQDSFNMCYAISLMFFFGKKCYRKNAILSLELQDFLQVSWGECYMESEKHGYAYFSIRKILLLEFREYTRGNMK